MLWNSAYETGIGIVDEQHKELFRQIDILVENKEPNAVPKVIDFLGQYVVKHFSTEEGLQRKSNYPDFVEHKKKHVAFVDAFTRLKGEYQESGQNNLILMKLTRVALDWLKQHIRVEDKKFAGHYFTVFPEEAKAGKPAALGIAGAAAGASAGKRGGEIPGGAKARATAGKGAPARIAKPAAKNMGGVSEASPNPGRRPLSTLPKRGGSASSPYEKPATLGGSKPSLLKPSVTRSAPGAAKPPRAAPKSVGLVSASEKEKPSSGLDLKQAPSDIRRSGGILNVGSARARSTAKPDLPAPRGKATGKPVPGAPVTGRHSASASGSPGATRSGAAGKAPAAMPDGPLQFSTASRKSGTGSEGVPAKPATPRRAAVPSTTAKKPIPPFRAGSGQASGGTVKTGLERISPGVKPSSVPTAADAGKGRSAPAAARPSALTARTGRSAAGENIPVASVRTTSRPATEPVAATTAKRRSPAATARAIPLTPDEEASAKLAAPDNDGSTGPARPVAATAPARGTRQSALPPLKAGRSAPAAGIPGRAKKKP
ncbi:MAG: bacteriohemerythrin [Planctomycetaceae bacterium]|nr:bacteriohemerythrin [Planctomycetaceae bacterium]